MGVYNQADFYTVLANKYKSVYTELQLVLEGYQEPLKSTDIFTLDLKNTFLHAIAEGFYKDTYFTANTGLAIFDEHLDTVPEDTDKFEIAEFSVFGGITLDRLQQIEFYWLLMALIDFNKHSKFVTINTLNEMLTEGATATALTDLDSDSHIFQYSLLVKKPNHGIFDRLNVGHILHIDYESYLDTLEHDVISSYKEFFYLEPFEDTIPVSDSSYSEEEYNAVANELKEVYNLIVNHIYKSKTFTKPLNKQFKEATPHYTVGKFGDFVIDVSKINSDKALDTLSDSKVDDNNISESYPLETPNDVDSHLETSNDVDEDTDLEK